MNWILVNERFLAKAPVTNQCYVINIIKWNWWKTREVCETLMPPPLENLCEEKHKLQIIEIFIGPKGINLSKFAQSYPLLNLAYVYCVRIISVIPHKHIQLPSLMLVSLGNRLCQLLRTHFFLVWKLSQYL